MRTPNSRPAVVLLSGGVDSTTTLAIARSEGFVPHALTIRYGQRHSVEIAAATRVAKEFGVEDHVILDLDLRTFGGSALTADVPVPKDRTSAEIERGIPSTYVPARNTISLSLALAWAEVLGGNDIFLGVNALDYSGYPDCRPEYIAAFQHLAGLATRAGVEGHALEIHTPLINLTKAQIIRRGVELGVDYSLTTSCYDPAEGGSACGTCDACLLRLKGFAEAGLSDPIRYAPAPSRMTYAVKEIFHTLQGEGVHTGRPAVFLRFAGCNLWTGREADRAEAICQFCDTEFVGTDGVGGGKFATGEELAAAVAHAWPSFANAFSRRYVVMTGGEPLLQVDSVLIDALHDQGFEIAIETNGTIAAPEGIDWICVSPKANAQLVQRRGNELKLVFPQDGLDPQGLESLEFRHFLIQPMDGPDRDRNTKLAIRYCEEHPRWTLSLQTHKMLGIP